jgi:hypothetical protein
MKNFAWIILLTCAGYTACKSGSKIKPLTVDQMKPVMWDLMKAGEWYIYIVAKDSSLRNKKEDIRLFEQVFAIHGITKDRFYSSYKYYESHPIEFRTLVDSLDAYSVREKNKLFLKPDKKPGQAQ